jgi:Leucine-rich repeat (LRR) protein
LYFFLYFLYFFLYFSLCLDARSSSWYSRTLGLYSCGCVCVCSNLKNLRQLYLDRNRFTAVPAPIFALTRLRRLRLSHNQISDLGPINRLARLHSLDLSYNHLSALPQLLSKLKMSNLLLAGNRFKDVPPVIVQLASTLEVWRLLSNSLELSRTLPSPLFFLLCLRHLLLLLSYFSLELSLSPPSVFSHFPASSSLTSLLLLCRFHFLLFFVFLNLHVLFLSRCWI